MLLSQFKKVSGLQGKKKDLHLVLNSLSFIRVINPLSPSVFKITIGRSIVMTPHFRHIFVCKGGEIGDPSYTFNGFRLKKSILTDSRMYHPHTIIGPK